MKKVLSIFVAIVFVMTAGAGSAFADRGGKDHGKKVQVSQKQVSFNKNMNFNMNFYFRDRLKEMKDRYVKAKNSKNTQEQLLRDIAALKKKYSDKSISVFVNGQEITTVETPVIKSGKLLLPLKAIAKGLKATYTYDESTGTVVITKGSIKVTLKVGSNVAIVNNTSLNLEYKVEYDKKNGVMIPLGLLAKLLNGKCTYDKDSGTVTADDGVVNINDNTTGSAIEQFNYAGEWSYGAQSGAYNNDNHWAVTTGSTLQFKFNGTKVKLYGAKAPNHGIAYISVDGTTPAAIDYYSSDRKDNTLIYESTTLDSNKEHTIIVIASGLKNTSSSGIAITADRAEVTRYVAANLALNKPVAATSEFTDGTTTYSAIKAVDGKADTRWSSAFTTTAAISVDLGSVNDVSRVKLKWETAYAKTYSIQISTDGANWTDASVVTNGDGGTDELVFTSTKARYVRMSGLERATAYGYSLYEFEVYSK
jgi:hypothetical protein